MTDQEIRRMRRVFAQLVLLILAGLGLGWTVSMDVTALLHFTGYQVAAYLLLAIGLYGAMYGIDLRQARQDSRVIGLAVAVGVVVKALPIGGILALAWETPCFCSSV